MVAGPTERAGLARPPGREWEAWGVWPVRYCSSVVLIWRGLWDAARPLRAPGPPALANKALPTWRLAEGWSPPLPEMDEVLAEG